MRARQAVPPNAYSNDTMNHLRTCALIAVGMLAACAPQNFRADVGGAFVRMQGEIGLQNSGGSLTLASNMNDVKDQLGSGETDASPYMRLEADWGPSRVKVSGFGHNSAGTGTLVGQFGDLPGGTQVSTDFDFVNVTASWSYDLMPTSLFRIAPGLQLGYYSFDMITRAQALSAFESVDTDTFTPMPYLDCEVDLGYVSVGANAGVMGIDLRDGTGRYWDAEAYVRGTPMDNLEIIAGLRYLLFDSHGRATNRDFDSDVDIFGWFIAGGIKF